MIRGDSRDGSHEVDRTLRWWIGLLAMLVAAVLGCQSEVDPSSISASVVDYGEFEIRKGIPTLVAQTSSVPCEQGRIFGVDYRIEVANGDYGVVPVEFRWRHPELAVPSRRLWGTESSARSSSPTLGWRETRIEGRVLWALEHPDELVSGRYEFQIRRLDDGAVLLAQGFDVQGC